MASSERTEGTASTPASTAPTSAASPKGAAEPGLDSEGRRGPSGTEAAEKALEDGLRCDLLMNARYHSSREAFLDTLHRVLMFLIIVLGAAAVSDLLSVHIQWIRGSFAACAVVFASMDLTADLSNRARCHALMKRRYFELLADLVAGQKSPLEVEALMHRFSAEEEPAFHALLGACWNAAQEMVYGKFADAYKIPLWHRALKNCIRFGRKYDVINGPRPATA